MSDSLQPHGLEPTKLLYPWDFPSKNNGVCCHFLLQGIFLTQESNPRLLHWQEDSLPLSHLGSPKTHANCSDSKHDSNLSASQSTRGTETFSLSSTKSSEGPNTTHREDEKICQGISQEGWLLQSMTWSVLPLLTTGTHPCRYTPTPVLIKLYPKGNFAGVWCNCHFYSLLYKRVSKFKLCLIFCISLAKLIKQLSFFIILSLSTMLKNNEQ